MKNSNSAPKGKEKTDKSGSFAKGGTTKMFPKMGVQPDSAGMAGQPTAPKFDKNAAKGGSGKMFGEQSADPSLPGTSSPSNGRRSPNNKFGANGGNGKMFGNTGSTPARAK
jgi:hypothetical protein